MDCLASRADQLTAFIYFVKHEAASLLGSTPMMSNSSFKPTPAARLNSGVGRQGKLNGNPNLRNTFLHFCFGTFAHAQEGMRERSDWRKFFSEFQAKGTIVVADERQTDRVILVFDQVRSEKRYSPASTFKIPHTLFALDAGAARDEFQVFRWDGIKRSFAAHNQDQDFAISNAEFYCLDL